MITLAFTPDCVKVMTIFASSPGSRWQRKDLQMMTRLSNRRLDIALKLLLACAIKREKRLYVVDFERSKKLLALVGCEYKRLRELPFDVYFALLDLLPKIAERAAESYLFGSYAKLVYTEQSDIDIALLYDGEADLKDVGRQAVKIGAKYGMKIELHQFERSAFYKAKADPLVKGILKDGVKLHG